IHYAENDERINAGWPVYEKALKEHHKKYEAFIYPGTQHGFNNDTTPRYDAEAAKLAWSRTVEFFMKHLGEREAPITSTRARSHRRETHRKSCYSLRRSWRTPSAERRP